MARRLIAAGKAKGDCQMPGVKSLCHNIYRWEHGDGVSPRYMLAYCAALGIAPDDFPRQQPRQQQQHRQQRPRPGESREEAGKGESDETVGREVLMAAHDGSDRAGQAEQRGIGDTALEQFRADVTRVSLDYMTAEPLPLFREMRRVRERMHDALERRIWPRDTTEIYFMLGCVNGLMACAAADMGYAASAEELARAGWAYAAVIEQRPLMAKLRLDLADLAYWGGQVRRAAQLAASGLEYLASGPTGAQLHLRQASVMARLGDHDAARRAIEAAAEAAADPGYDDDLTALGGEYELSRASLKYLTGAALMELPGAGGEAATQLEQAVALYQAGPEPGETHGYGIAALASVRLAEALLDAREMEAAADALEPVLGLPLSRRIDPIPQGLTRVRNILAQRSFRGSALARDLDERIEEFSRERLADSGLRALSA
jgi:hypothetical protein